MPAVRVVVVADDGADMSVELRMYERREDYEERLSVLLYVLYSPSLRLLFDCSFCGEIAWHKGRKRGMAVHLIR